MPQTIYDLGKAVKSKYAGQYDDLPDDEVGRRVQAKYPGAYDDYEAAPAPTGSPDELPATPTAPRVPATTPTAKFQPVATPPQPAQPIAAPAQPAAQGVDFFSAAKSVLDFVNTPQLPPTPVLPQGVAPGARTVPQLVLPTAAESVDHATRDGNAMAAIATAPPAPQTISANPPGFLDRLTAPFTGPGSAYGNVDAQRTGARVPYNPDAPLVDFSANAPQITGGAINKGFTKGAQDFLSGFTTPQSIGLLLATGGLGAEGKLGKLSAEATGKLAAAGTKYMPAVRRLVSGGFSLDMIRGALMQSPELIRQIKKGDVEGATKTLTTMGASLGMGAAAGAHAVEGVKLPARKAAPPAAEPQQYTMTGQPIRRAGEPVQPAPAQPVTGVVETGAPLWTGKHIQAGVTLQTGHGPVTIERNAGGKVSMRWQGQSGTGSYTGDFKGALQMLNAFGRPAPAQPPAAPVAPPLVPVTLETPKLTKKTKPPAHAQPVATPDRNEDAYRQAVTLVRDAGKASTSALQRTLRLGYGAASRMLDRMEAEGIIGPADGSKPREVLKAAPAASIPVEKQEVETKAPEPETKEPKRETQTESTTSANVPPAPEPKPQPHAEPERRGGEPAPAVAPDETQVARTGAALDVDVRYPLSPEAHKSLMKSAHDPVIAQIARNAGITRIRIDEPHTFDLSQQGGVTHEGVVRLNPNAHDLRSTLLHELGEIMHERSNENDRARLENYARDSLLLLQKDSPGYVQMFLKGEGKNEAIAQTFAIFDRLPTHTQQRILEFQPSRRFEDVFRPPAEGEQKAVTTSRKQVRTWEEAAHGLRDTDDLDGMVEKFGDRQVSIKDVNGGRHRMPASIAARALENPLVSGHVRGVNVLDGPAGPVKLDNEILNYLPTLKRGFEQAGVVDGSKPGPKTPAIAAPEPRAIEAPAQPAQTSATPAAKLRWDTGKPAQLMSDAISKAKAEGDRKAVAWLERIRDVGSKYVETAEMTRVLDFLQAEPATPAAAPVETKTPLTKTERARAKAKKPNLLEAVAAKRIAQIDAQLEKLDAAYLKRMNKPDGARPPAIKADALASLAKMMDKLETERRALAPSGTPAWQPQREIERLAAEAAKPEVPDGINPQTGKPWPKTHGAIEKAAALAKAVGALDVNTLTEAEAAKRLDEYYPVNSALYELAEKTKDADLEKAALDASKALERAVQPLKDKYEALRFSREADARAAMNKGRIEEEDARSFERATTVRPKKPTPAMIDARRNDPAPAGYKIAAYKNGNRLLIATGQPGIVQTFDTREWQWTDEATLPVKKARERYQMYAETPVTQDALDQETGYIYGPWAEARGAGKTEVEAAPEPEAAKPAITLSPAAQASEAASRANRDEYWARQEAEEAADELKTLQSKYQGPGPHLLNAPAPGTEAWARDHDRITELREQLGKQLWQRPQAAAQRVADVTPAAHRKLVERALAEGKTVPPEVLADYPDLKAANEPAQPAAAPVDERPYGETEAGFMARNAGKKPHEMSLADWHRFAAYEYMAGGERREALIKAGLGTDKQRTDYWNNAVKEAAQPAAAPVAARAAEPSAEEFDRLSKEADAIERDPQFFKDTPEGSALRDRSIELREHEIDFHRPAAIARAQAEIDAEKGKPVKVKPLAANAEATFTKLFKAGIADRLKEANLTANPNDVRKTFDKFMRKDDHNTAVVGDRAATVVRKIEAGGKRQPNRITYTATVTDPKRPMLRREFSDFGGDGQEEAAGWVVDRLYGLGDAATQWREHLGGRSVSQGFYRAKRTTLLEPNQSGLVAADAAAKAIGQPALAHDIYDKAFMGGWKAGELESTTLASIGEAYANSLPRNDAALETPGGRPGPEQSKLIAAGDPAKGYETWESQIEGYERTAKGITAALEGIRKRIAIAQLINGGTTPRIEESVKVFEAMEANTAKNLAFVREAAKEETRKLSSDLKPGAHAAAEAYAKYGETAFEGERTGTGATTGQGALDRYMRINDVKGYDAALAHFGIEPAARPKRIELPYTGKGKLLKAERQMLESANLTTGSLGFVSQGSLEKFRERGWATDELTDEGKAAVYSYRMDKAEGLAGLPMDQYVPDKRPTLPAEKESRFAGGASAWNLVDGKVWYTNGHGAWKGEYPKNWPARDVNKPGPDIARVMPDKKGSPVTPIGFTRIEHEAGDTKRTIYFENDAGKLSGLDADYYDYTNSLEPDLKWTQTDPKSAFQAHGKDGLRAVVMPMRVDAVPSALESLVKGADAEPAKAKAKKLDPRAGAVQLDLLSLGLTSFIREDVAPAVRDVAAGLRDTVHDILKTVTPTLLDAPAQKGSALFRGNLAELARKSDRARHDLRQAIRYFTRQPIAENYEFIERMEKGQKQATPQLDTFAGAMRQLLDDRRAAIQALGTGKLQNFYKDYFPHIWKKPKRAETLFAAFFGKRPLEGGKSFLKKRTLPTFADGLAAGLEPVTDNPADLVLLKAHEMDRYIMAHETLADWKQNGLARFVDARKGKAPRGWRKIDDAIGTVYGPSIQQISEYPNEALYTGLQAVAKALGITHERGFLKGMGDAIGRAYKATGHVKTVHGSAEGTLAHEIGHQIDWLAGSGKRFVLEYPDPQTVARLKAAYGTLKDKASTPADRKAAYAALRSLKGAIADRKAFQKELRDLADLRQAPQAYRRSREEKMAQLAQMWVEGRELFARTAPTVFARWKEFLDNPKLHALRDIEAGANKMPISQPYDVGGLVIRGHYYAPEGAARILNNYLSPGLRQYAAYRAISGLNNTLNQHQLGLSAFHLGFTAADTTVSKLALGYQALMRGKPITAAKYLAQTPTSAFTTFLKGDKMLREWLEPGSRGAEIGKLVDNLVTAGGRARMDQMYRTDFAEKLTEALRKGNPIGAAVRAPFAAAEYMSNLIMNEVVPRMKMGAFADLARFSLERLPADATDADARRVLIEAWNSVENRLGEMTYDNLFWDKTAKDLAMLTVRSVGWNLGTLREVGGAIGDIGLQPYNALKGRPVNLNRLSYVMALVTVNAVMSAIYQKLKTGEGPDEPEDYFFPKNGERDEQGRPQRVSWPTYIKDLYHYGTHPLKTIANKAAPIWGALNEMIHNRDFYGNEIRHADDPLVAQLEDAAKYLAKQNIPIGVRNVQRERALGATRSTQVENFFGITPAPAELNKTPAERMAAEMTAGRGDAGEGRPAEAAERRELRLSMSRALRNNKPIPKEVLDALRSGKLRPTDLSQARRDARRDPLERAFASLTIEDAVKVYRAATAEERKKLAHALLLKARNAIETRAPAERPKIREAMRTALAGR